MTYLDKAYQTDGVPQDKRVLLTKAGANATFPRGRDHNPSDHPERFDLAALDRDAQYEHEQDRINAEWYNQR